MADVTNEVMGKQIIFSEDTINNNTTHTMLLQDVTWNEVSFYLGRNYNGLIICSVYL